MDKNIKEMSKRLDACLPRLMLGMRRNVSQEAHRLKLSSSQLMVMMGLRYCSGSCTMSDICKDTGITTTALTTVIDGLIKLKMVRRVQSPADRRKVVVTLTAAGTRATESFRKLHYNNIEKMMSMLDPSERAAVVKAAEKGVTFFEQPDHKHHHTNSDRRKK